METHREVGASPESRVPLASAWLRSGSDPSVFCRVEGIDGRVLRVSVEESQMPRMRLGEDAELEIDVPGTPPALRVRLVERRSTSYGTLCGFSFAPDERFLVALPRELRPAFERRRTLRVHPDDVRPIAVVLQDPATDLVARGKLVDISHAGVGVELCTDVDRDFSYVDQVVVSFGLPHDMSLLHLGGWIRRRRLEDDKIHYGIEFDPRETREFARQQASILRYVESRVAALSS